MIILRRSIETERGDELMVTAIADEKGPSVLVTLDDSDRSPVPTAELTVDEAKLLARTLSVFSRRLLGRRSRWTKPA